MFDYPILSPINSIECICFGNELWVKLLFIYPFSSHHLSICEFVVMVLRIFLISECKTMATLFSPTKAPPQPPQVLPLNFPFLELLPVLSGTTSNCGTTSFAVTSSDPLQLQMFLHQV